MKKAVALVLIACFAGAAAAQEVSLRVMSFNVRYGTAPDGKNAWPKRKDIVVNCVKQADADIIGLQECLEFQARHIVAGLPEYQWVGVSRDPNGKGEMTAVLYRTGRLSPVLVRHFWLSEQPEVPGSVSWDSSLTRMATLIRFQHQETGRFFTYVNTHLDHKGEQARVEGIGVICRELEKEDPALPVVMTGDFNAKAGASAPYTRAMESGLRDAWVEAPEKKGPPVTWSAFSEPKEGEDSRIDWVLFRGNVSAQFCETVLYNEDGRYPTDHFPVLAGLTLAP